MKKYIFFLFFILGLGLKINAIVENFQCYNVFSSLDLKNNIYIGEKVLVKIPKIKAKNQFIFLGKQTIWGTEFINLFNPRVYEEVYGTEVTYKIPLNLFLTQNPHLRQFKFQPLVFIPLQLSNNCDECATALFLDFWISTMDFSGYKKIHFDVREFKKSISKKLDIKLLEKNQTKLSRRLINNMFLGLNLFETDQHFIRQKLLKSIGINSKRSFNNKELRSHLKGGKWALIISRVWEVGSSSQISKTFNQELGRYKIERNIGQFEIDDKGKRHTVFAIALIETEARDYVMILDSASSKYHFWSIEKFSQKNSDFLLLEPNPLH